MEPMGFEGGEDMYWTNEFNLNDKEIRHMHAEFLYAAGIFTVIVWCAFLIGSIL
jgi:hypothetical protein